MKSLQNLLFAGYKKLVEWSTASCALALDCRAFKCFCKRGQKGWSFEGMDVIEEVLRIGIAGHDVFIPILDPLDA